MNFEAELQRLGRRAGILLILAILSFVLGSFFQLGELIALSVILLAISFMCGSCASHKQKPNQ